MIIGASTDIRPYMHRQIAWAAIIYIAVAALFVAIMVGTHVSFKVGLPLFAIPFVITTTRVDNACVRWEYLFGLGRRSIAIQDIEEATVVQDRFLSPRYVEIRVKGGKVAKVTTNDSDGLLEAIERSRKVAS